MNLRCSIDEIARYIVPPAIRIASSGQEPTFLLSISPADNALHLWLLHYTADCCLEPSNSFKCCVTGAARFRGPSKLCTPRLDQHTILISRSSATRRTPHTGKYPAETATSKSLVHGHRSI